MSFYGKQRYQKLKSIGKGAQCVAYLKKSQKEIFREVVKEFIKERMNKQQLNELLKIHVTYEDDFDVFVITEYCNGGNLEDYLKKKLTLSSNEIVNIIDQIGKQLQCLHNSNYIYQDLKPENIVIQTQNSQDDSEKLYKICDFGSVIPIISSNPQSKLYTVDYSAPEGFEDEKILSPSIDIWSFAILINKLITGKNLFTSNNDYETKKKIEAFIRDQTDIHEKIDSMRARKELKTFFKENVKPYTKPQTKFK